MSELPPADENEGRLLRTVAGLYYSDGFAWVLVDAAGVFSPITQEDYDELSPEDQTDPFVVWVIVPDATGLVPTRTWTQVEEDPETPDPDILYIVIPLPE